MFEYLIANQDHYKHAKIIRIYNGIYRFLIENPVYLKLNIDEDNVDEVFNKLLIIDKKRL